MESFQLREYTDRLKYHVNYYFLSREKEEKGPMEGATRKRGGIIGLRDFLEQIGERAFKAD